MASLQMHPDTQSAVYAGESIPLLPKEYALLDFLHRHPGQAFSRVELLDRVWPLEEPVDRTVDDHVYRLRKKLKRWEHLLAIDTIRNHGYRLTLKQLHRADNPLLQDSEFMQHVYNLFNKFHQFGQGEAMKLLAEQQRSIGVEQIPFYTQYVRVMSGDFLWLVDQRDVKFRDIAYHLLHIHFFLSPDIEQSLAYYQTALQQKKLSVLEHRELEILNILDLYLLTDRVQDALDLLPHTHETVERYEMEAFKIPVGITEIKVHLLADDDERTAAKIREMEDAISAHPYLREQGSFAVAKGLWLLKQGNRREGVRHLDEGLDILRRSQFVPMLLRTLKILRYFLGNKVEASDLLPRYDALWQELAERHRFEEVLPKVQRVLAAHLT